MYLQGDLFVQTDHRVKIKEAKMLYSMKVTVILITDGALRTYTYVCVCVCVCALNLECN